MKKRGLPPVLPEATSDIDDKHASKYANVSRDSSHYADNCDDLGAGTSPVRNFDMHLDQPDAADGSLSDGCDMCRDVLRVQEPNSVRNESRY